MIAKLLPPNIAHKAALRLIKVLPATCSPKASQKGNEVVIRGLVFPNPVGLAAGFDKDCSVLAQAFGLGFGFVEGGTLTPLAQPPNPGETIQRFFSERAIFNRLGFPSEGAGVFIPRLKKIRALRQNLDGIMGVNIGCNRSNVGSFPDYLLLAKAVGKNADYLTVNISSPNTQNLRKMQEPETIKKLATKLREVTSLPLFVKLSPDIAKVKSLAESVLSSDFDGVILTNSSSEIASKFTTLEGGISGLPLRDKSIEVVSEFAKVFKGKKPIIGCGGISTANDVLLFAKAGAHLIQLYSAMVFEGLFVARKIVKDLSTLPPLQDVNPHPLKD